MAIKLEDAVAVVQKEIRKWREKYESVANENGQDYPIMVEGVKLRPTITVSLW